MAQVNDHKVLFLICLYTLQGVLMTAAEVQYVFAVPPSFDFTSEVRVTAKEETTVTLRSANGNDSMVVPAGSMGKFNLPYDQRVNIGIENKALELTSDKPATITISAQDHTNSGEPDEIYARPVLETNTEFYVMSKDTRQLDEYNPYSYYTVAASYDNTDVHIYNPIGKTHTDVTLNRFDTFTVDAYSYEDQMADFSGVHITTSHPVAVISGHGRWYSTSWYHHISDSMPSVADLGTTYITFPVGFGDEDTGYFIRVLATENATEITGQYVGVFLDAGQYSTLGQGESDAAFKMVSSSPFVMTQFTYKSDSAGGMMNQGMGSIMVNIVPVDQFVQDVWFTTPYMTADTYAMLSIVTETYPVTDLYLNNQSLVLLDWTAGPGDEFAYAMLSVEQDLVYHMYTDDPLMSFAGYVYTTYYNNDDIQVSKGYSIGYKDELTTETVDDVMKLESDRHLHGQTEEQELAELDDVAKELEDKRPTDENTDEQELGEVTK